MRVLKELLPEEVIIIIEMDNLLSYVSGINDERDSVPILLGVRERWPRIKALLAK